MLLRDSEDLFSFGVRQLAAAFASASLLAVVNSRERARGGESGSKLPHSKASPALPTTAVTICHDPHQIHNSGFLIQNS